MKSKSGFEPRFWALVSLQLVMALGALSSRAANYQVIHHFTPSDGSNPNGELLLLDGTLYGATYSGGLYGGGTVYKINPDGNSFSVLKHFPQGDESQPCGDLIASAGTLYGTTWGGTNSGGTVFKLNVDGTGYTVLKHLAGDEGYEPRRGLLLDNNVLYGTAFHGGTNDGVGNGNGTIFKLNTDGSGFTVLRRFLRAPDGRNPQGALILHGSTLYGTTMDGGPDTDLGSVFKIETDGTGYSQLHYCSWWVGFALTGRLLEHEGSLYKSATCYIGAPGSIVFKIGLDGSGFTILKWFDAMWAYGSLISTGEALFGTTASGGSSNLGTVFTVNTDGTGFGILKSFYGSDGSQPVAGMVMSGNTLYGTTYNGGISNCGVVFSLSLEPPTIITPPTSQTVEIGSDTRFSVSAGGDPFGYQWFFNDTNVITAVTTNSTLLLTNVQLAQAGAYTVRVSDPIGAVTSPPAMLGVITPVPRTRGATLILQGPAGSVLNLDYRETAGPNDNWTALDSVLLTNPPAMYCDPSVPLLKQRFYRAWHTNTLGSPPALKLSLVPALLLVGAPGDSLRLEYINPVGPVDAWVPLAVVPLANALQFYFDTSALGQPERLYRISPMP